MSAQAAKVSISAVSVSGLGSGRFNAAAALRSSPEQRPKLTHGLAVGNRDRGQLDQARRLHFVRQPPDDVPDSFFNRDLPRITQRRGDGFDGLSLLVLIALLETVAFTGKLIAQTCGDVTDPTCFE
ncbi:hypothetical protein ACPESN_01400 [Stutzerimonas marianensis]|uniref:hypothetical protein n=1 Tax=Stutzerimonas marianensis TaxID=2929513 RepID=UPI003C2C803D